VDEKCNPGGPHFDYLFFSVYTSIIARVCTAIGVYLFQVFFSNANVRFAFWMSAVLSSFASLGDLIIVKRWNRDILGLSDKAFYLVGDTILEPMVGMMAAMPSVVLMSKMCPPNMEATMFAILASFNNLGASLSSALGVFAMEVAGIKTDLASNGGECDFSGLPELVFWCGMIVPLLTIPLTFIFVPNINMRDVVNLDTGEPTERAEIAPLLEKTHTTRR